MRARRNVVCAACLAAMMVSFVLSGCAGPQARQTGRSAPKATVQGKAPAAESLPAPSQTPPPRPQTTAPPAPPPRDHVGEPRREPTPRTVASLRLTEQARSFIEAGQPDQAIRTLEKALNLNPSSGENFYYLSEAWLIKGNLRQAEEFNRLATLHFKGDGTWGARAAEQTERIRKAVIRSKTR